MYLGDMSYLLGMEVPRSKEEVQYHKGNMFWICWNKHECEDVKCNHTHGSSNDKTIYVCMSL